MKSGGGGEGIGGAGEDGEEVVALAAVLDEGAVVLGEEGWGERVVSRFPSRRIRSPHVIFACLAI